MSFSGAAAQETSDSLIVRQLRDFGVEFTDDNSVTLLMSGQQKFDDMFTAIRQAQHSVHLEYFNFRNDSIASLLFDILREKRKEGVEVRALFDGFGNDSNNQPLKKHHLRSLRSDSVDIHEFDPIRFPWVNHIWPRDHRKIVVIDGCVAYTGGMNVADYYINGTEQVGSWRDMHCRIEGSAVNQLQHIFARIWKNVTDEDLEGRPEYFPIVGHASQRDSGVVVGHASQRDSGVVVGHASQRDSSVVVGHASKRAGDVVGGHKMVGIVNREPGTVRMSDGRLLGRNKAMRYFYVHAIDDAQDSIRIINPYFTLIPSVKKALKRAIKRGVKVDIMLSAKSDIPLTPDVALHNAHKLMKKGANVWLYLPGFHHSKIMMVDGRFCTVGSANLDARSLRFDYEENAVIIDPSTTRQLDEMFNRDIQESIRLTPETWKQNRTRWQRFRGWASQWLRPFL